MAAHEIAWLQLATPFIVALRISICHNNLINLIATYKRSVNVINSVELNDGIIEVLPSALLYTILLL